MAKESVRELGDAELLEELKRVRASLFDKRFELATGQLEDHTSIKRFKKSIARIETELREREIAAAEAADRSA